MSINNSYSFAASLNLKNPDKRNLYGISAESVKTLSSYISAIEDERGGDIPGRYIAFKNGTTALVKAFRSELDRHGSIHDIPLEILKKYSSPLGSLLDISRNLRENLKRQMSCNSSDFQSVNVSGDENSSINITALRRMESLNQKIEYFDNIELLHVAIELCIERKDCDSPELLTRKNPPFS